MKFRTRTVAAPAVLLALMQSAFAADGVPPANPPIEPASGWIMVRSGIPAAVLAAIKEYASLLGKDEPKDFRVSVARHRDGGTAVRFPDGSMPYELVNLIGWLDHPPNGSGVAGAQGWVSSPGSSVRYGLRPEVENPNGDTLIGTGSDGGSVRVYVPEAALCGLSETLAPMAEPDPDAIVSGTEVAAVVVMDVATDFGNPRLVPTHAKDCNWNSASPPQELSVEPAPTANNATRADDDPHAVSMPASLLDRAYVIYEEFGPDRRVDRQVRLRGVFPELSEGELDTLLETMQSVTRTVHALSGELGRIGAAEVTRRLVEKHAFLQGDGLKKAEFLVQYIDWK